MSRDGNGNYSLPAGNPVSGGTTIDPTWANTTLNDMAVALTGSVSSDGQTTMTGNIKMNGNTLTNLAAATSRSNPPNVGQVQDSALTLLSSVSGTDTITASVAPAITSYTAGQNFQFVSAGANTTTTVTININGLGAKNVLRPGGGALAVGDITSGQIVELYYNGTNFEFVNTQHAKTADLATTATTATSATTSTYAPQIQVVSSSVAGNALTVGYSGGVLDFRSATATSGAITAITVGPLSLTVPAGATLGTTSGQSARIAIIAINNAGTVEIAVCNLSGGVNLDETSLISTTVISAAATSASVIYSNTSRSNVAFRVVGFIDITEATAGTWATAPTLVQGCGGQALTAMSSLGYGQAWQGVTRTSGVTYYNTTGKPVLLCASMNGGTTATLTITVNGVAIQLIGNGSGLAYQSAASLVIPPGASYTPTYGVTTTFYELR